MSSYIRNTETILTDFVNFLNENNANLKLEEIIQSKKKKEEILEILIDKCYDTVDGFWYFVEFIIGPDPVRDEKIWNTLVQDFWNITRENRRVAILCPRGHGKSYFFSILYPLYLAFLFKRTEILLITNITKQAKINLKKLKDLITDNELLDSRRERDANWNQDEIEYNKSSIYTKSLGGVTRGIHANLVVADDILRDDQTYSNTYILTYFKESIIPTAQRKKGKIVIVGTPQSSEDIFHEYMKNADEELITKGALSKNRFFAKVYRAIIDYDTKEVLLPNVLNFEELMEVKDIQGNLGFEKEYQCHCVSDKTAIFPEYLLRENFLSKDTPWEEEAEPGMNYVIAADVATSGAASADFSAFVVLKIRRDKDGEKEVVHIFHAKGMDVSDQVDKLESLAKKFNNAAMLVEKNNVGVALIQELIKRNVNVEAFVTDRPKKEGAIRYLQNEIKRGRITVSSKIKYYDEIHSLFNELLSFGIRIKRGKESMEALSGHDDLVDALWLANLAAQQQFRPKAIAITQN